jgi:predicted alpha/beta-hydrolase family hydrolase
VLLRAGTLSRALRGVRRWVLGGHSLGARAAARAALGINRRPRAQGGGDEGGQQLWGAGHRAVGLVLSSFPVHPPGKPVGLGPAPLGAEHAGVGGRI